MSDNTTEREVTLGDLETSVEAIGAHAIATAAGPTMDLLVATRNGTTYNPAAVLEKVRTKGVDALQTYSRTMESDDGSILKGMYSPPSSLIDQFPLEQVVESALGACGFILKAANHGAVLIMAGRVEEGERLEFHSPAELVAALQ